MSTPLLTEKEFLEWVGVDSQGVPRYLHLLNLQWSKEGVDFDLDIFRSVEARLREHPKFWSAILRGSYGWRTTLVGCACLLLSKNKLCSRDVVMGFECGSIVQPQLAVTLGLLDPIEAPPIFRLLLEEPKIAASGRAAVSAQRALQLLGELGETDVRLSGWPLDQQDEATLADRVVRQHWDFWSSRVVE